MLHSLSSSVYISFKALNNVLRQQNQGLQQQQQQQPEPSQDNEYNLRIDDEAVNCSICDLIHLPFLISIPLYLSSNISDVSISALKMVWTK